MKYKGYLLVVALVGMFVVGIFYGNNSFLVNVNCGNNKAETGIEDSKECLCSHFEFISSRVIFRRLKGNSGRKIDELLVGLTNKNSSQRIQAIQSLAIFTKEIDDQMVVNKIVRVLKKYMKDRDENVRIEAHIGLAEISSKIKNERFKIKLLRKLENYLDGKKYNFNDIIGISRLIFSLKCLGENINNRVIQQEVIKTFTYIEDLYKNGLRELENSSKYKSISHLAPDQMSISGQYMLSHWAAYVTLIKQLERAKNDVGILR